MNYIAFLVAEAAILIRSCVFLGVGKKTLIVLLIAIPMLSGCVYVDKMVEFLTPPPHYEWIKVINVEESFGWLDVINAEMAKTADYPIFIKNDTRYLHIYIHVDFSNPINPDFETLSQGNLNLTIIMPDGENVTKSYCTTGKLRSYDDYFYFTSPQAGEWKITVKVAGYGKYKIVAQTYQPA